MDDPATGSQSGDAAEERRAVAEAAGPPRHRRLHAGRAAAPVRRRTSASIRRRSFARRRGRLARCRRARPCRRSSFNTCSCSARPRQRAAVPHERADLTALTIAGSDSSGGAGIQADLKTFAALGVYGTSAITAITAQNTLGVIAMLALSADLVTAQIEAVAGDIDVARDQDRHARDGGDRRSRRGGDRGTGAAARGRRSGDGREERRPAARRRRDADARRRSSCRARASSRRTSPKRRR